MENMQGLKPQVQRFINNGKKKVTSFLKIKLKEKGIERVLIKPLIRSCDCSVIIISKPIETYLEDADMNTLFSLYYTLENIPEDIDFIIDISKQDRLVDAVCGCNKLTEFEAIIYELHLAMKDFEKWKYKLEDEKCDILTAEYSKMFKLLVALSYRDDKNNMLVNYLSANTRKDFVKSFSNNQFKECIRLTSLLSRFKILYRLEETDDGIILSLL